MANDKLISVVIPCYNHEKYIYKTVMSVLQQTYSNLELLVADDCSTDGSVAVLSSIQDPRLKTFFFEKNRGTVYTLNFLLQQAKGDYLVTLGSDDWFYPEKLEKQLKVMEEDPSLGAVFSWAQIVDGNDAPYAEDHAFSVNVFQEENRSQGGWLRYFFEDGNHLCHSSAMVRRQTQDAIGLYRATYRQLHDFDYWLRLICKYPIYVIPEKLVAYRRQDEVSSVSASKSAANTIRLYNEFNKVFYELFVRMDWELFAEAFGDMLSGKDISDPNVLAAEKYKVLRTLSFNGCGVRNAAHDFFANYIDKPEVFNDPDLPGKELLDLYYGDLAKMAVEYPLDSSALAEMLPSAAREIAAKEQNLNDQIDALWQHTRNLEGMIANMRGSVSWKVTKPLRFASLLVKKP